VWEAAAGGRRLTLHLAGINNQNFLMQDEETGSWWQQVTGEAILGPLKGTHLRLVPYDEVSFSLWRREHPGGRVLRPAAGVPWREFSADWEAKTARLPAPAGEREPASLAPRALVLGVEVGGAAIAYPVAVVERQSPLLDTVGGVPVVILAAGDGGSLRAFEARLDGRPVTLYLRPRPAAAPGPEGAPERRWIDAETGSEWDFAGRAIAGPAAGRRLARLRALREYWFDWRTYHPRTAVYRIPGVR
jgi:hypothetical protein